MKNIQTCSDSVEFFESYADMKPVRDMQHLDPTVFADIGKEMKEYFNSLLDHDMTTITLDLSLFLAKKKLVKRTYRSSVSMPTRKKSRLT